VRACRRRQAWFYLMANNSEGSSQAHLTCIWRINRTSLKVLVRCNVHADSIKKGEAFGASAPSKGKAMTMLNTAPRYAAPTIWRGAAVFLARLGRLINRWIAAFIAQRERQASLVALRYLSDRDLKDIGINRCDIGDALVDRAKARLRMQQSKRP
jgi:uncharacterized protein YjiS (DUF1127 family)